MGHAEERLFKLICHTGMSNIIPIIILLFMNDRITTERPFRSQITMVDGVYEDNMKEKESTSITLHLNNTQVTDIGRYRYRS